MVNPLLLGLLFAAGAGGDAVSSVDGYWQQQGYGVVLHLQGDRARLFDVTESDCVLNEEEPRSELGEVSLGADGRLDVSYGINRYRYDRLAALPSRCHEEGNRADPLRNFDSLWQTMNEHYAFFGLRGVDWAAMRARYRSQLTAESTNLQLFSVLKSMLRELKDSHVDIETPDDLAEALAQQRPGPSGPGNFQLTQQAQSAIMARYIREPKQVNAGIVRWGLIDDRVGYLQLNAMLMLADYGLDQVKDLREFGGRYFEIAGRRPYQYQDEVDGARNLVQRVLADLGQTHALIIDLRFNGGGKDEAALTFLRPFVRAETFAFDKKAREKGGATVPNRITLRPSQPAYKGKVFLLTSVRTASAAEIMVLASLALPPVERIGGTTEGIFSDTLDKRLPNGWPYTLSNEIYTSADGRQFESTGIPPDHPLAYSREPRQFLLSLLGELEAADGKPGSDAAIELALRLARGSGLQDR